MHAKSQSGCTTHPTQTSSFFRAKNSIRQFQSIHAMVQLGFFIYVMLTPPNRPNTAQYDTLDEKADGGS